MNIQKYSLGKEPNKLFRFFRPNKLIPDPKGDMTKFKDVEPYISNAASAVVSFKHSYLKYCRVHNEVPTINGFCAYIRMVV